MVFVVEEGMSNSANIVAASCQHLLNRVVVWSMYHLAQGVKLMHSNHISDSGYVIEYFPHMFVVESLDLNSHH